MTSYKFAKELTDNVDDIKAVDEALAKINLLDAHLDLDLKTNITLLEQEMDEIAHWDTIAQWVHLKFMKTKFLGGGKITLKKSCSTLSPYYL